MRQKAERVLEKLALKEGVPIEHIREKIQEAIDMAIADPDPDVRQFWDAVPREGDYPSPEELLCYLLEKQYIN